MKKVTLQDMIKTPMNLKTYQEEENSPAKKIGRQKGRKREKVVLVYLSEEEKQKLQEDADRLGLGLTQYVRLKIFQN